MSALQILEVYEGTDVVITAVFKDENGALTDPTTITLRCASSDVNETSWTYGASDVIVRTGLGTFVATISTTGYGPTMFGTWVGTGDLASVQPFTIRIMPVTVQPS